MPAWLGGILSLSYFETMLIKLRHPIPMRWSLKAVVTGTDFCHNLHTRLPNITVAVERILPKYTAKAPHKLPVEENILIW